MISNHSADVTEWACFRLCTRISSEEMSRALAISTNRERLIPLVPVSIALMEQLSMKPSSLLIRLPTVNALFMNWKELFQLRGI